tara:strand:- start:210 stop:1217 length:1008 start_codon:yes stop_codon:yes gene_type:complete
MATIFPLRSPRYEILTTPSGAVSAKLELTIDSTLRYTIIKECTAGATVTFEIAELCRDYIDPTLWTVGNVVYSNLSGIAISREIKFYDGANATGSIVSGGTQVVYEGFDGFGEYMDGANPTISQAASDAFLIDKITSSGGYEIFMPESTSGWIVAVDGSETKGHITIGTSVTSVSYRSSTCAVTRVGCSKYTPIKVYFVNKLGAVQWLYFFTKDVELLNTSQETYQRNTIDTSTTTPSYFAPEISGNPTYPHPITTYNKNGKTSYSLSSGYYPERANPYFEQLLLSEDVWIEKNNKAVSVQVRTSNMTLKTSLNDNLIDYTIQFEEAFDYINNIR